MIKTDITCYRVRRWCRELLLNNFILIMCSFLCSLFCLISETNSNNNNLHHILKQQTAEVVNNGFDDKESNDASLAREKLLSCTSPAVSTFEIPVTITVSSASLSNIQYRGYRGMTGLCLSAVPYLKERGTKGRSVKIITELPKEVYVYMIKNLRI